MYLVPLHPADLPHADALGVSVWVQWAVVLGVIGVGVWLIVGARAERRAHGVATAPRTDIQSIEDEATEPSSSSRTRLVRAAVPAAKVRRRAAARERAINPLHGLVTIFGFAAGWAALDKVRAVDALGGFIRTDGAAQVARLGFAFAALLWVGAALAPVAPRGAAVAFVVASAIAAFLAVPDRWEVQLEWWGAKGVLDAWDRLPLWSGGALLLAVMTVLIDQRWTRRRR